MVSRLSKGSSRQKDVAHRFRATLWVYGGVNGWHFITVPNNLSRRLYTEYNAFRRGWNSLPVRATIGSTTWHTSVFFDTKTSTYLLPVKMAVRKKEQIGARMEVLVLLSIRSGTAATD